MSKETKEDILLLPMIFFFLFFLFSFFVLILLLTVSDRVKGMVARVGLLRAEKRKALKQLIKHQRLLSGGKHEAVWGVHDDVCKLYEIIKQGETRVKESVKACRDLGVAGWRIRTVT